MATVLVNGSPEDVISPADRGLTLGDGLFETIAVREGEPRWWSAHMERLRLGCSRLRLPTPDLRLLLAEADQVIGDARTGSLRITLTRGPGKGGYALPSGVTPTRVVSFAPLSHEPVSLNPVRVRSCRLRLARQPALAGLKHLNRLEQILARAEWSEPEIADGLLYDTGDCLIEATACNIFLVTEGRLVTPDLSECGVSGVMRSCVISAAEAARINVAIRRVYEADLLRADEVFLAGSAWGIRPVQRIDDRLVHAPGPVTAFLADAVDRLETVTYREH